MSVKSGRCKGSGISCPRGEGGEGITGDRKRRHQADQRIKETMSLRLAHCADLSKARKSRSWNLVCE